jgi:predicted ATP-dependent serine protease
MHECEHKHNPERGKCDACEAWSEYVRICHPLERTDEEETP